MDGIISSDHEIFQRNCPAYNGEIFHPLNQYWTAQQSKLKLHIPFWKSNIIDEIQRWHYLQSYSLPLWWFDYLFILNAILFFLQRMNPTSDIKTFIIRAQNASDIQTKFDTLDEIIKEFPVNVVSSTPVGSLSLICFKTWQLMLSLDTST